MATRKRKKIPDSVRFEVFKRDSFKCQYCGKSAPEAVLVLDHIEPHSKGGSDQVANLITSCRDCNSGKGDRRLSDDSVVAKQKEQLDDLQERRSQIEMMLRWRQGLEDIEGESVEIFRKHFNKCVPGWRLEQSDEIRKLIRKFGLACCLDAIRKAADVYVKSVADGKATEDAARRTWRSVWVFCQSPETQDLYMIRGILRNRLNDWDESEHKWSTLRDMKQALAAGVSIDDLRTLALSVDDYSDWFIQLEEMAG